MMILIKMKELRGVVLRVHLIILSL